MLRQAQHERGGVVHRLICHPDTPANAVSDVDVALHLDDARGLILSYHVADGRAVAVPRSRASSRADDLWQTTCFEMFWRLTAGEEYFEYNFSPSTEWAAYRFERYRTGREDLRADFPEIRTGESELLTVAVDLDLSTIPIGSARIGLSAVIEEIDGTKSYWALRHPPGAPDFHHPDCFALELPALRRP